MNFKQLESFVQVAELGSFSKAALVQGIAQPALSRQVRALEIALRETLLLRNGRGVVLTEAGQRLYEHGVNILQALAQAESDMGERGHAIRKLLETQALLAGLKLQVAWEVSSIAAIIDLVCAGYGHAVLHASAVAASGRADQLQVRPVVEPRLNSVLCLAVSAHKRPSPLMRQATRLLTELVRSLPQGAAAQSQPG